MRLTPLHLQLVIHYSVYVDPPHNVNAPAVREYTLQLADAGILEPGGPAGYRTTERGRTFLEMLCETPFPVQQWIDPRTRDAEHDNPADEERRVRVYVL